MVTLPLERMASRVAASLCYATGLGPEMVVSSQQEYEVSLLPLPLSAWVAAPLHYAAAGPRKGFVRACLKVAMPSVHLAELLQLFKSLGSMLPSFWLALPSFVDMYRNMHLVSGLHGGSGLSLA